MSITVITATAAGDEEPFGHGSTMRLELRAIGDRVSLARAKPPADRVVGSEFAAAECLARELTARTVGAFMLLAEDATGNLDGTKQRCAELERRHRALTKAMHDYTGELKRMIKAATT